jgi:hypothetical protein
VTMRLPGRNRMALACGCSMRRSYGDVGVEHEPDLVHERTNHPPSGGPVRDSFRQVNRGFPAFMRVARTHCVSRGRPLDSPHSVPHCRGLGPARTGLTVSMRTGARRASA